MRDLMHEIQAVPFIPPQSDATNTPIVSSIIDLQGCDSITFFILTGAIADADVTFTTLLQEGMQSNMSDAAPVAVQDMISSVRGADPEVSASFNFASVNSVFRLGYVGNKRYLQMTITPANNTSAASIAALAVRGHLASRPS
jgi:hypothetical protein